MDKEAITSLLKFLTLTPTESSATQITIHELEIGLNEYSRSLIGRFLSNTEVLIAKSLKIAMTKEWSCPDFIVIRLSKNTYQFIFENADDTDRIQSEGPWSFDNHLLILKPWIEKWETDENFFNFLDVWVHVVGLPSMFYSPSIGRRIARSFVSCTVLELREDTGNGKKFFRLRISINVNDPLRRFVSLELDGNGVDLGLVLYEQIPNICFNCGHLDHTLRHCNKQVMSNVTTDLETSKLPYGPWLAANHVCSQLPLTAVNLKDEIKCDVVEEESLARHDVDSDGAENLTLTPNDRAFERIWKQLRAAKNIAAKKQKEDEIDAKEKERGKMGNQVV